VYSNVEGRVTMTVPPLSAVVYRANAPVYQIGAAPQPMLRTPANGAVIGGRAEIAARVPGTGFVEATFAARPVGSTGWTVLGTDDNAPYRVFADTSRWAKGTLLELRTVVRTVNGQRAVTGGYALVGDPVKAAPTGGGGVGGGGGAVVQPNSVTVAGSLNSEMGCAGDWDPACPQADLTRDTKDDVWKGAWTLPAGEYEYKAAINDSWDENYGLGATPNGANIPLSVPAGGSSVSFYYDHRTHWIADNLTSEIVTAPGSFQSELGCPGDWDPTCMRSWLQDPDKDGIYTLTTASIPAGAYEGKAAHDLSWDENYGAGGAANGANIPFTVGGDGVAVTFSYNSTSHVLTITSAKTGPTPDLKAQRAHWVDRDTILWDLGDPAAPEVANRTYRLHWSTTGDLEVDEEAVAGGFSIPLRYVPGAVPASLLARFPHLKDYEVLRIPRSYLGLVKPALRSQLAVASYDDGHARRCHRRADRRLCWMRSTALARTAKLGVTYAGRCRPSRCGRRPPRRSTCVSTRRAARRSPASR
jgi:hypothetical protein